MDKPQFKSLGSTGLKVTGGWINEEKNKRLKNIKAYDLYNEMRNNDPVIGAILFVVEYLLSSQEWTIDQGEGKRARKAVELVKSCMLDMEHTWNDFIASAASMVQYGWAFHEIVYKKRDDGAIGWQKIALRAQDTLDSWVTDEYNNVISMVQYDMYLPYSGAVPIPLSKGILFTTTSYKSNPEGRSVLRSAVRPYKFLMRLQEIEAVGIERELAGLPVLEVPSEYLDPSGPHAAEADALLKSLANIRRDEYEGVLVPASKNINGNPTGFQFSLMSSGGKRSIDPNVVINRYENRIATTMLAQFILLGQADAGSSYALADTQQGAFTAALQAMLNRIKDEINKTLISRLMRYNGFSDPREWPKLRCAQLQDITITHLATFINQLVASNVIQPDDELEAHVRNFADLPKKGAPRALPVDPFGAGNPAKSDTADKNDPNVKREGTNADAANVRTEQK